MEAKGRFSCFLFRHGKQQNRQKKKPHTQTQCEALLYLIHAASPLDRRKHIQNPQALSHDARCSEGIFCRDRQGRFSFFLFEQTEVTEPFPCFHNHWSTFKSCLDSKRLITPLSIKKCPSLLNDLGDRHHFFAILIPL